MTSARLATMTSPSADLIDGYLDQLRIQGRSPRTIDDRRIVLTRFDRELPWGLDQADPDEIAELLYLDEYAPNTRATYYDGLNGFYQHHVGRNLRSNPMDHLPRPQPGRRAPRPATTDQVKAVVTRAAQPFLLWGLLAAYAGARCVEVSRLDREDITEEVIYLRGKGDKDRAVPTHRGVWAVAAGLPAGPVAVNSTGRRASAHTVSQEASRHFQNKLKLVGLTMHRLRHWAGTYGQRATRDTRVTQEFLGHASPSTTALYTQVAMEDMRAAVDGLPWFSAADPSSADRQ